MTRAKPYPGPARMFSAHSCGGTPRQAPPQVCAQHRLCSSSSALFWNRISRTARTRRPTAPGFPRCAPGERRCMPPRLGMRFGHLRAWLVLTPPHCDTVRTPLSSSTATTPRINESFAPLGCELSNHHWPALVLRNRTLRTPLPFGGIVDRSIR